MPDRPDERAIDVLRDIREGVREISDRMPCRPDAIERAAEMQTAALERVATAIDGVAAEIRDIGFRRPNGGGLER